MLLIFGMTLMVVMGVSSITPAFPRIMNELGLTKGQVGMLISLYSLPGVFCALPFGIMADRGGRKRVLVPSLLLFGIAGGACAFTRDFTTLLALRFLQGVGATAAGVLNPTIIGDLYTGRERTVAMSYNIGVLNIGTAGFPVIGGALAMFAWSYPFLLPLVAIPLGIATMFVLDSPLPETHPTVSGYLRSTFDAIVSRRALGLFFITLVTFIVLYGAYLTYLPLLIHSKFGSSSLVIGVVMSSVSLTTAITTTKTRWLLTEWKERQLMVIGFILIAAAMFLFPLMPKVALLAAPALIYGLGNGINSPSAQSILIGLAPENARAGFLSVNSTILRIGQSLGPFVMGMVAEAWGMNGMFYTAAICSLCMLAITVSLLK